jgi:hypothetical protein
LLTKYDRGLIYFLLFSVFFSFLGTIWIAHSMGRPSEAVVLVNGKTVARFALQGHSEYRIKGALGDSVIRIEDGKVRVSSSPCLQKICVHTGYIQKSGECIVCAPNQLVVKIKGESKEEDLDAVSK